MTDSILRKRKIMIKCSECLGHKAIFGRSAMGHPATLPCESCDATGEVEQGPVARITSLGVGSPLPICVCDIDSLCPVHPTGIK